MIRRRVWGTQTRNVKATLKNCFFAQPLEVYAYLVVEKILSSEISADFDIKHMPAVKFSPRLDFERKI